MQPTTHKLARCADKFNRESRKRPLKDDELGEYDGAVERFLVNTEDFAMKEEKRPPSPIVSDVIELTDTGFGAQWLDGPHARALQGIDHFRTINDDLPVLRLGNFFKVGPVYIYDKKLVSCVVYSHSNHVLFSALKSSYPSNNYVDLCKTSTA